MKLGECHVCENGPHYSEGRRYSYILNAWILDSSWNDKEEIAALRNEIKEISARRPDIVILDELKKKAACVCGDIEHLWTVHRLDGPCYQADQDIKDILVEQAKNWTALIEEKQIIIKHYQDESLENYSAWLNLAHDFGANDGDDMRQVVSDGIARLQEQNAALGSRVGQFQFCINRVAEALGNVCCGGVDSSPEEQLADPDSTTRVLCDAIEGLKHSSQVWQTAEAQVTHKLQIANSTIALNLYNHTEVLKVLGANHKKQLCAVEEETIERCAKEVERIDGKWLANHVRAIAPRRDAIRALSALKNRDGL